jgi:hypothetical protein
MLENVKVRTRERLRDMYEVHIKVNFNLRQKEANYYCTHL